MSFDDAINHAAKTVPECVAAGFVDIASGMLLALKTVDSHPQQVIDLLAAATADMFAGPNVSMIERLFKRARGLPEDDGFHYFQEVIVNSENLIHVFLRGKVNSDYVVVFVCRRTANLGMALTKARLALAPLEAAF